MTSAQGHDRFRIVGGGRLQGQLTGVTLRPLGHDPLLQGLGAGMVGRVLVQAVLQGAQVAVVAVAAHAAQVEVETAVVPAVAQCPLPALQAVVIAVCIGRVESDPAGGPDGRSGR